VPTIPSPVAYTLHCPLFFEQFLHPRPQDEPEVRVALRLRSDELQETRLGHHHYVRELSPHTREEVERERAAFGRHGEVPDLRVTELEEAIREPDLV